MNYVDEIKRELKKYIDKDKAEVLPRFFKTGKNEYGEGDLFIGITVPNQRKVAKKYYKQIKLSEIQTLLENEIHEYRLTALLILVNKFEKTNDIKERKVIVDFYLLNYMYVNNWDLVDTTAYKILGAYLIDKNKDIIYEFANSNHLWKQRIAIISTFYFIKQNSFEVALDISKILLYHEHDLIHKAVGWMLREIGNRQQKIELIFLNEYYNEMPRTMLRYAIEKFEEDLRKKYLKGLI